MLKRSCDICRMAWGKDTPAVYDAKLKPSGQWGYVCQDHYARFFWGWPTATKLSEVKG